MELSRAVVKQFVEVTTDDPRLKNSDNTVYGEIVEVNGGTFVKIDGSEAVTPVATTAKVHVGDRVVVTVKNHTATVMGNTTDPSASNNQVVKVEETVKEYESIIVDYAHIEELIAKCATIEQLEAEYATIKQLEAEYAKIATLEAEYAKIGTLEAEYATIKYLEAEYATIDHLEVNYVTIGELQTNYATIDNLTAVNATIENLTATYATIADLNAIKATIESLDVVYADIDFANITEAAFEKIYAEYGLIEDLTFKDGTITGKLSAVTIDGDLINANTLRADRLIIRGKDGLYYQLNAGVDGVTESQLATEEYQTALHGSNIIAQTITADKISVSDLVAFGATIGGLTIDEGAIYSGVKESIDNTTTGFYLDKEGHMNLGNMNQYIKFYNGKLEISAGEIILSSSNKSIETLLEETASNMDDSVQSDLESVNDRIDKSEASIRLLENSLSMLVQDANGQSLMTQTADGWVFSTASIQKSVDDVSNNLADLTDVVGDVDSTVEELEKAVGDLGGVIGPYVRITTYEDEPCIELGEDDSDFKLLITNTRIMFREGSSTPAYISNKSLYIDTAVIENELKVGKFIWKIHGEGNFGIIYEG